MLVARPSERKKQLGALLSLWAVRNDGRLGGAETARRIGQMIAKSYTVISKSGKEWHNVKNVGYHEFITEDGIVIYFSGDFIRIEKR